MLSLSFEIVNRRWYTHTVDIVAIAILLLPWLPWCHPFVIQDRNNFALTACCGQPTSSNGLKNHDCDRTSSDIDIDIDIDDALAKVMEISSGHFKSQALHSFVKLGIPNILGDGAKTIDEISQELSKSKDSSKNNSNDHDRINQDALYRTMRLLTSLDVVIEADVNNSDNHDTDGTMIEPSRVTFQLTPFGKYLQDVEETGNNKEGDLAACILHWLERPLWNSWSYLPEYILGEELNPFEQANGVSSDYFYNAEDNPQSLEHANRFVRVVSDAEINSIVKSYDWSSLRNKTIVDIGGYNGKVLGAISSHYTSANLTLKCLDLPHVIKSIDKLTIPDGVELIEGNVLEPSTIPKCDVIFMKHFLDRCMWSEEDTVKILKTCSDVTPDHGMIILGEAAIPSIDVSHRNQCGDNMLLSLDAFYMLVGRDRQRTVREWKSLAQRANMKIERIIPGFASCYLIVLTKESDIMSETKRSS